MSGATNKAINSLMKLLLIVLILGVSNNSYTQSLKAIQKELEAFEKKNLELRSQVMPTVKKYGFKSPQMDSLDHVIRHFDSVALNRATNIIETSGWLGKSQIGEIANRALFLIIQHAPENETRKKYFPLLKESVNKKESDLADMATMKDRILIQDGEKQIYGTQSKMVDGQLVPYPIADPKNVNKRRKSVGLGKLKY